MKSIDLQVIVPRIPEVGRIQHVKDHGPQQQQEQFAQQFQQQATLRQKQVQHSPKTMEGKIDKEARDNRREREKKQRNQQDQTKEEGTMAKDPKLGKKIDITI